MVRRRRDQQLGAVLRQDILPALRPLPDGKQVVKISIEEFHKLAESARLVAYICTQAKRACTKCLKAVSVVAIPRQAMERFSFFILCSSSCEEVQVQRSIFNATYDDVRELKAAETAGSVLHALDELLKVRAA